MRSCFLLSLIRLGDEAVLAGVDGRCWDRELPALGEEFDWEEEAALGEEFAVGEEAGEEVSESTAAFNS